MKRLATIVCRLFPAIALLLGVVAVPSHGLTDEPGQAISDPGFRPESEYAVDFLEATGTAKIAVLPTLVRRAGRTAHSFTSQEQIVAFLNESGIAVAETMSRRIDLGSLRRPTQWEIFQYGAESIGENLEGYESGADYTLVMELLVPGDQAVFGIEIYILDQLGRNAFSFLLNSHHELFAKAELVAKGSSEAAREKMIEDATRIGLAALKMQIEQARECMTTSAAISGIDAENIIEFCKMVESKSRAQGRP